MIQLRQGARKTLVLAAFISIMVQSMSQSLFVSPKSIFAEESEQTVVEDQSALSPTPEEQVQVASQETPNAEEATSSPLENQENDNGSNEDLNVLVLKNSSESPLGIETIELGTFEKSSSAILTTDQNDYTPIDTALISGSGLIAESTYTLIVSSKDAPVVNFEASVTTDQNGTFVYEYQLDGNYRPNYKVEVKDNAGNIVASITFTDGKPAKPDTITSEPLTTSSIKFQWKDKSTDEDDFHVQRKLKSQSDASFSDITTVTTTTKASTGTFYSFTDTSLSCNTEYSYRVLAHRHDGSSDAFSDPSGKVDTSTLYLSTDNVTDLTPDYATAGSTNVPIFSFVVTSCNSNAKIKSVKAQYSGTNRNDVTNLKLYQESGSVPGTFSAVSDTLRDTAATGGSNEYNLDPPDITIGANTVQFYVTADFSGSATNSNVVDAKIFADKIDIDPNNPANTSEDNWPLTTAVSSWDPAGSTTIGNPPDTTPPTVSSVNTSHANGSFKAGEIVDFIIGYSENVIVTGSPSIALNSGGTATYLSGTGSNTLTFRYIVGNGDTSFDLTYSSTSSLSLNGGTIKDAANNSADNTLPSPSTFSGAHAMVIDTTAPVLDSKTTFSGWHTTNQVSEFTYTDINGPLTGTPVACNITTQGVNQTCSVTPNVCDNAGNCNVIPVISNGANIDKTNPTDPADVQSSDHTANISSNDNTIAMTWTVAVVAPGATDSVSGVDGYSYVFSNSSSTLPDTVKDAEENATGTTSSALSDGSWYFHLRTRDNAGNWTSTVHVGPFIIDTLAPQVNITSPLTGDYVKGSKVITFDDDETTNPECSIDDATFVSCVSGVTTLSDITGFNSLSDGDFSLYLRDTDSAGNTGLDSQINIVKDTTAPSTADNTDNAWHNSNVTVILTCDDGLGSGCDVTYFTLDGSTPTESHYDGTGSSVFLSTDGEYIVKYFSLDNIGNKESVKTADNMVKIDKTNPTDPTDITSSSHVTSTWSNDNTVSVSWSGADDNLSGVAGYSYFFDNSSSTKPDHISEGLGTSATSDPLDDDNSYYFHLSTLDNAGNWTSTVHFGPFFIDNTSPLTPSATPGAGDYVSDQEITLESSDDLSGLDGIFYTTDGSTPNKTKTKYTDPIVIGVDTTLKAIAYDNAGNQSDVLTAEYGIAPVISDETSDSLKETSATITWNTDDPATSRVLYDTVSHTILGTAPNYGYANSTVEDPVKVLAHSVTVSELTAGTTYYYRTISHGSPESKSSEKSFTTTNAPSNSGSTLSGGSNATSLSSCSDSAPGSAPKLLSAASGANSVTLTWSEASDPVSYYLIAYGTSSGAQTFGNPNIGGKGTTTYTVSGLSGGTTYYFRVRAGNGCKPGDYSNELSETPTGSVLIEPALGFSQSALNENSKEGSENKQVLGEKSSRTEDKQKENIRNLAAGFGLLVLVSIIFYLLYRRKRKA